jgi:hypothetical protein
MEIKARPVRFGRVFSWPRTNNYLSLDGFAGLARLTGMFAPRAPILNLVLLGMLLAWSAPDSAMAQSDGLDSATGPVMPDPVPGHGTNFPPSMATSGTAYGGPPLSTPHLDCSPFNPCALASSAPRDPDVLNRLTQ